MNGPLCLSTACHRLHLTVVGIVLGSHTSEYKRRQRIGRKHNQSRQNVNGIVQRCKTYLRFA